MCRLNSQLDRLPLYKTANLENLKPNFYRLYLSEYAMLTLILTVLLNQDLYSCVHRALFKKNLVVVFWVIISIWYGWNCLFFPLVLHI